MEDFYEEIDEIGNHYDNNYQDKNALFEDEGEGGQEGTFEFDDSNEMNYNNKMKEVEEEDYSDAYEDQKLQEQVFQKTAPISKYKK